MKKVTRHCGPDAGSTAAEYALIASLIAIVALVGILVLGNSVFGLFDSAASSVSDATNN